MRNTFEIDPYPGKTRILFVGHPLSTHVHSWIDLLADSEINVRFFAIPFYPPPGNWPVRTYLTLPEPPEGLNPDTRKWLHLADISNGQFSPEQWLSIIIRYWQPDIVHTFGIDPASLFFANVRRSFQLRKYVGTWVVQTRGGSDLTLARFDPDLSVRIHDVLNECDEIITDNKKNFEYIRELNVPDGKIAAIAPVPGTGGINAEEFADARKTPPSKRERIIVWPKAYECPWSKSVPVFEAIREAWQKIAPCKIYMLAANPEGFMWFYGLPKQIREHCHIEERIPRASVLDLLRQARVMLAPSLVDGIPNSLYEAMACGAFPIVSPLETIATAVTNEENVLFARNLQPEEIAKALVRAMSDDDLIDNATVNNLRVLREFADRSVIRTRMVGYYERLSIATSGNQASSDCRLKAMLLGRAMELENARAFELVDRAVVLHDSKVCDLVHRAISLNNPRVFDLLDRAMTMHSPRVFDLLDRAMSMSEAEVFDVLDRAMGLNNPILFGLLEQAMALRDARFLSLLKLAAALNNPRVFRLMTNKHGFLPAKTLAVFHVLMRRWGICKSS
jgi:glycosyltransferase involved in cell wall biosynthesis